MADTPYIVFEKTRIQRIEDPEKPEEFTEVTAYIPVAGDDSGRAVVFANSGSEASRKAATDIGIPLEEFGHRSLRAIPARNWSGVEAGTELKLVFDDVLPPKFERGESDEPPAPAPSESPAPEPEPQAQPNPEPPESQPAPAPPEPQPVASEPAPEYPDAPGSEPDFDHAPEPEFDPEPEEPEFDPSLAASGGPQE